MKMKSLIIHFVVALFLVLPLSAQYNTTENSSGNNLFIGAPEKIISGSEQYYMAPSYSPDGNFIAFTSSNYKGVWIKNLLNDEIKKITGDDAAGFGFEWSPDSKVILSRAAKFDNGKRYNAVKLFFTDGKQEKLLTDYKTFMPGLPHFTLNGEAVYLYDGKNLNFMESGISASSLNKNISTKKIAYSKDSKIYVVEPSNKIFNSFEPIANQEYLNLTVSPDGQKIAFEVYGGNLYSMNSDGSNLIDLGKGSRPKFSFDSKKIIYMIAEDNGENYTSSDIYAVNSNGADKIQLTQTDNVLEMNPSFSPDGKNIIYYEMNEGAIYILPVIIP